MLLDVALTSDVYAIVAIGDFDAPEESAGSMVAIPVKKRTEDLGVRGAATKTTTIAAIEKIAGSETGTANTLLRLGGRRRFIHSGK